MGTCFSKEKSAQMSYHQNPSHRQGKFHPETFQPMKLIFSWEKSRLAKSMKSPTMSSQQRYWTPLKTFLSSL